MAGDDKTMRMVTNLDRKAIEGKLVEARAVAQSSNLAELAAMFSGVEGMPRGADRDARRQRPQVARRQAAAPENQLPCSSWSSSTSRT